METYVRLFDVYACELEPGDIISHNEGVIKVTLVLDGIDIVTVHAEDDFGDILELSFEWNRIITVYGYGE